MKYYIIYIVSILVCMVSCTAEDISTDTGHGTLCLGATRTGASSDKIIDEDLAIKVFDNNGNLYVQYPAGGVPNKIILEPGVFTIHAYTDNQETWAQANNGLGEACYYGETQVDIEFDQIAYVNMQVPLTNYAVTLTLPDMFQLLFKSHSLSLTADERAVEIQESQKAYFKINDGGFTYKLSATNIDNISHATSPITYKKVEAGKLYNITYYYGTDANSGGLDIEITDDMETEDDYLPLSEEDN